MPQSLITINKLIEMLLQDVRNFNIGEYQDIISKKFQLTQKIRKKQILYDDVTNLSRNILPRQISIVNYYAERLPRIKRIVDILRRSEGRVLKNQDENYKHLLKLLQRIIQLGDKNLPLFLEEQQKSLETQNLKRYISFFNEELKVGYKFVKQLSKVGIRIDHKKFPHQKVNKLRLAIVILGVVLVGYGIIGLVDSVRSPNRLEYTHNISECMEKIGIQVGNGTIEEIDNVLNRLLNEDLKNVTAMESQFESLTGLNVIGDFTQQDLELTKLFFEKTYGFNTLQYSYTHKIVFLPPGSTLKYINAKDPKCAEVVFQGLSRSYINEIFLLSSEDVGRDFFLSNLSHEFAHQIHIKVGATTDFNVQWDKIVGGYARNYGKTNRNEDVATVVEEVVSSFLKGKSVGNIRPVDGNYEAFQAKVRLLKMYNFLPPVIEVR